MKSPARATARATLLIIISTMGFASLSTLAVLTTRAGLPLIPAMLWRYLLACVVLFTLMKLTGREKVAPQKAWRLILIGGAGQAVITYLSLYALNFIPVGPLAFMFYTYPAWLTVISAIRGMEPLTLPRLIALVVAMAGITVMVGTPSAASLNPTGVLMALGSAILYALYLPGLHAAQKDVEPLAATFYLVCGVSITFLAAATVTGQLQFPATPTLWGYVILMGVVCTVMAFVSLIAGLRILGPVRTSIIATVEPFFTSMFGVIFLREALSAGTLVGGVLIASAILLLQWHGNRMREQQSGPG